MASLEWNNKGRNGRHVMCETNELTLTLTLLCTLQRTCHVLAQSSLVEPHHHSVTSNSVWWCCCCCAIRRVKGWNGSGEESLRECHTNTNSASITYYFLYLLLLLLQAK